MVQKKPTPASAGAGLKLRRLDRTTLSHSRASRADNYYDKKYEYGKENRKGAQRPVCGGVARVAVPKMAANLLHVNLQLNPYHYRLFVAKATPSFKFFWPDPQNGGLIGGMTLAPMPANRSPSLIIDRARSAWPHCPPRPIPHKLCHARRRRTAVPSQIRPKKRGSP